MQTDPIAATLCCLMSFHMDQTTQSNHIRASIVNEFNQISVMKANKVEIVDVKHARYILLLEQYRPMCETPLEINCCWQWDKYSFRHIHCVLKQKCFGLARHSNHLFSQSNRKAHSAFCDCSILCVDFIILYLFIYYFFVFIQFILKKQFDLVIEQLRECKTFV